MAEYIDPVRASEYADGAHAHAKRDHDARAVDAHDDDAPPAKAAKHAGDAPLEYSAIDFLGNVSGGPHAAAAEALATFSSSVGGEGASSANMFAPVPSDADDGSAAQVHQNGPPFACHTCQTTYSRLEYLRRHERRHADIRPFACPCGKSFSRSDVLARHKTKCRVVLSGEAPVDPPADARPRAEQPPRAASSRTARPSRRGSKAQDGASAADAAVDPALAEPVDPALQPPPPLEPGAGDAVPEPYAFSGSDSHAYAEYAPAKGHAGQGPPGSALLHAQLPPSRGCAADAKAHPGAGPHGASVRSSPYMSGSSAIHPELSARGSAPPPYGTGAGHTQPGAHSAGTSSPNANAAPSPCHAQASGDSAPPAPHTGHGAQGGYENAAQGSAPPAPGGSQGGGAAGGSAAGGSVAGGNASPAPAPASSAGHGKEPTRFSVSSSGPLSPFSNTALSSTMSPYFSAFSCARDIPHSSSPRSSAGSAGGGAGAPAASAPGQGAAPPSDAAPSASGA
ncbi:hypothetical protein MSPP1_002516 [Malassezia sp. CBS 17886]|nr:hypothetical protein MSPP1_002516 [Malassezia sp. CBS 17886]